MCGGILCSATVVGTLREWQGDLDTETGIFFASATANRKGRGKSHGEPEGKGVFEAVHKEGKIDSVFCRELCVPPLVPFENSAVCWDTVTVPAL